MGPFAGLSPRRRVLFAVLGLAIAAGLVAATTQVIVERQHAAGRRTPAQDRPGPVLLVPGYGGGTAGLDTLASRLRQQGRAATVVRLPGDGTGDLTEQARTLDGYVERALRDGAESVDVVGYSAGGVVARAWTQLHDGPRKARRIVTLGAPHHGAMLAATGAAVAPGACPAACRQLAPGSRFLAGLREPVPNPPLWMSLWTVDDQTVRPAESAALGGALNVPIQSLCPGRRVSHADLPTDAAVTALVLGALGAGPVAAPVPVECS